ncbi:MAG: hypothetical protein MK110_02435 [Fuerstiella sp.]|nr:hypothetical protein [Fuerstiella sp.]
MDPDLILPVISRWAHIGCAIVLIGGSAFIWLVLQPVLRDESSDLHDRIRGRWKMFVHPGVLILLFSGVYNFVKAVPNHRGDLLYHMLLGTKMLLALIVFALASILVGNKPGTQKIRNNARKWLGLTLLLAIVIVGISGFVKIRPYSVPSAASVADANTE